MCLTYGGARGDGQCVECNGLERELKLVYEQMYRYFHQMQKLTAENQRLRANLGYRPEKLWGEM
jgi:hypothetical protein